MGIIAKKSEDFERELIPAEVHLARCKEIYDIGHQHSIQYDKWQRKVVIVFELPDLPPIHWKDKETKEERQRPASIASNYTLSLGDKAKLRADLEAWRGKPFTNEELEGFDLTKLLDAPCQVQVIHKPSPDGKKTYANISGIMKVPKGVTVPKGEMEPRFYSLESGTDIPEWVPTWILKKIKQSREWQEFQDGGQASEGVSPSGADDDNLPF